MRTLLRLALMVSTASFLLPTAAWADLAPGQIGLFADPLGTNPFVYYEPGVVFDLYILANVPETGLKAWEASFEFPGLASTVFFIVGTELDDPQSIDVGIGASNFIVGLGGGCQRTPGIMMLARIQIIATDLPIGEQFICLTGASPSSLDPLTPAYANCQNEILPLEPAGCVLIDDVPQCDPGPARTFVGFPGAVGTPGGRVEVPFAAVSSQRAAGCEIPELVRLVMDASWDEAVVVLEDLSLAPFVPSDWTASSAALPGGGVRIEVFGTTPIQVPFSVTDLATLGFRFAPEAGSTTVTVLDILVEDAQGGTYPRNYLYSDDPQVFTSTPVAAETISIGTLKARF